MLGVSKFLVNFKRIFPNKCDSGDCNIRIFYCLFLKEVYVLGTFMELEVCKN